MDSSVIDKLKSIILAGDVNTRLDDESIAAFVASNDYKLESYEHLLSRPLRQKPAELSTDSLPSFVDYVAQRWDKENSAIFVSASKAVAIFDFGSSKNPMWRRQRAELNYGYSDDFSSLINGNTAELNQERFIDFIYDFENCFTFYDGGGNTISVEKAITAIRRIETVRGTTNIYEQGDFKTSHGEMETIEFKNTSLQYMPTNFDFTCSPLTVGTDPLTAICRMRAVFEAKEKPRIAFRIKELSRLKEAATARINEQIRECFGPAVLGRIYEGKLKTS